MAKLLHRVKEVGNQNTRGGYAGLPILFRLAAGFIALCALALYFLMTEPEAVNPPPESRPSAMILAKRVISFSGSQILAVDFQVPPNSKAFMRVLSDIDAQREPFYEGYRFRYYSEDDPLTPRLDVFASEGMSELMANFENSRREGTMMLAWNER